MGGFSLAHWLIVLIILLLLFGPNKLPQLGRMIGKSIRSFKQGYSEIEVHSKDIIDDPELVAKQKGQKKKS
ncbi:MAG: twin-arginine translocase TatA/TatE family subunit [Bdellovibrionia bacterium]